MHLAAAGKAPTFIKVRLVKAPTFIKVRLVKAPTFIRCGW
jgi:hypothetical protein